MYPFARPNEVDAQIVAHNQAIFGRDVTRAYESMGLRHKSSRGDYYLSEAGEVGLHQLQIRRATLFGMHPLVKDLNWLRSREWPIDDETFSALSAAVFAKDFNGTFAGKLQLRPAVEVRA